MDQARQRQAAKRYIEQFNTDFIGLSGSGADVGTLAEQLFVAFSKVDQADMVPGEMGGSAHMPGGVTADGYMINHNIHISLVNPEAGLWR